MREAISGNQSVERLSSVSVVISGHQRSSAVISAHQCSSVLISAHQCSSVLISGTDLWSASARCPSEAIRGN
jgi:hypothetical protein